MADCRQILDGGVALKTWIIFCIVLVSLAYGLRLLIRSEPLQLAKEILLDHVRNFCKLDKGQPVPTTAFIGWALRPLFRLIEVFAGYCEPLVVLLGDLWDYSRTAVMLILLIIVPIPILWTLYAGNVGLKAALAGLLCISWLLLVFYDFATRTRGFDESRTHADSRGSSTDSEAIHRHRYRAWLQPCLHMLTVSLWLLRLALLVSCVVVGISSNSQPLSDTQF